MTGTHRPWESFVRRGSAWEGRRGILRPENPIEHVRRAGRPAARSIEGQKK